MPLPTGHPRRHPEQGMTLLEMLIVLGVVGAVMALGFFAMRSFTKSDLRADSVVVASALTSANNMAAQSGMHHRVVFDLDQQTFRIEVCPDPIRLLRGDKEEVVDADALRLLAEQPNPLAAAAALGPGAAGLGAVLGEVSGAESPEAALEAAAALSGVRVGTARCGIAPGTGGDSANHADPMMPNVYALGADKGIKLRRVYVQHLRDDATSGEVSVNFFPLGHAEKALLELADEGGSTFTVLVHGLTGRIEVRDGAVDADKHMRRDGAGKRVDDR
jgi:prepilin-type N-terminal cleavage/methylation domain-containing protein